jgi:protein TonB
MAHGASIAVPSSRAAQRAGAVFAIGMHLLIGAGLLMYEPARSALLSVAPIMVSLITPPRPEAKPPETLPRPKPVAKPRPKAPEPQPPVAAPVEAPSPSPVVVAPPPPPAPARAAALPPFTITSPIFAADYLDNPPPPYPALSRRIREQGRVVLRVLVSPGGSAQDVEIRSSSGHARLDESARDTVRRWRFVPAKRGDEPVPAWVLIPISFSLEG